MRYNHGTQGRRCTAFGAAHQRVNGHRQVHARAADTGTRVFDIPPEPEAATKQVKGAVIKAFERGSSRQIVNALLPLIGATDLDDWPGGIRQMFKAALPMVETVAKGLRDELGMDGRLEVEILEQGDAVGAWYNDSLLVVIFPTADVLNQVEQMADGKKLVVMINPQWHGGQVISDFGLFGRKKKEDFVNSFETSYSLQTKRIAGEDARLVLMEGRTQLFVVEGNQFKFVKEFDEVPQYSELEGVLSSREGSMASKSLVERMQANMAFISGSMKQPPSQ